MENNLLHKYHQKRTEQNEENQKLREKENIERKNEYRNFLLKQIDDKEKKLKEKQQDSFQVQPFSEELTDATEKHNLKLLKQQEERNGLDECVRIKNDLKLEIKQNELQQDKIIAQFCKKRDNDILIIQEQFKDKAEKKEHRNNEVALLWMAQKTKDIKDKDLKREKVMDALIEKEMMELGDQCPADLCELHATIKIKRNLLKQTEEKISVILENIKEVKIIRQKLLLEIAEEEEELIQELEKNGRLINVGKNETSQNSHEVKYGYQSNTVISDHRRKKTLMEHN